MVAFHVSSFSQNESRCSHEYPKPLLGVDSRRAIGAALGAFPSRRWLDTAVTTNGWSWPNGFTSPATRDHKACQLLFSRTVNSLARRNRLVDRFSPGRLVNGGAGRSTIAFNQCQITNLLVERNIAGSRTLKFDSDTSTVRDQAASQGLSLGMWIIGQGFETPPHTRGFAPHQAFVKCGLQPSHQPHPEPALASLDLGIRRTERSQNGGVERSTCCPQTEVVK